MVISASNVSSSSGKSTDTTEYGTKRGTVVITRASTGQKEYYENDRLIKVVSESGSIATPINKIYQSTKASKDVGFVKGAREEPTMGFTPKSNIKQSEQYTGSSVTSLLTGTSQMSIAQPTIIKLDQGYVDLARQQSVYAPQVTKEQIRKVEEERAAQVQLQKIQQEKELIKQIEIDKSKSLFQKFGEKYEKTQEKVSEKLFPIVINNKRQIDPFGIGTKFSQSLYNFLPENIKLKEEKQKQERLMNLYGTTDISIFYGNEKQFGYQLREGIRKEITEKPLNVAVSAAAGSAFKGGEVIVGEVLPTTITGSKIFQVAGLTGGVALLGYQEVIYSKDIVETSFGEATGKLLVDLGAFGLGYKGTELAINKITDITRTRNLIKQPAEEYFSSKTVEGETIKKGLATSPSLKSTVKQFQTGIKGQEGFVSTGSPKPLQGTQVIGGEKAGLEDLGLYVSPKGEAQPLFTRVQSGKEIPTEYSLNLFANIGASKPTLTNIYGVKQVKYYPAEVVRVPGFQAVSEYAAENIGKGFVYPTKRSMIGQGVIPRQTFKVPYDIELGGKKIKAGTSRVEAGTSEAEAIIGVGEKFEIKPSRYYTELEGRRIVIEERKLLSGEEYLKSGKTKTTSEVIKDIKRGQKDIYEISGQSKIRSSVYIPINISNIEISDTSKISELSSISKVSEISKNSQFSNISNISELSSISKVSKISKTSDISNISNISQLSSISTRSKVSEVSSIKPKFELSSLPKLASVWKEDFKSNNLFSVEVGRKGRTKVFEEKQFGSLFEAEKYLAGKLKSSVAASGVIKVGGKVVDVGSISPEFTKSKTEAGRVVQLAKYRISSEGEKAELRKFKKMNWRI